MQITPQKSYKKVFVTSTRLVYLPHPKKKYTQKDYFVYVWSLIDGSIYQ